MSTSNNQTTPTQHSIYIGCDPGLTGAIAVITLVGNSITSIQVIDVCTKERSKTSVVKRKVDARQTVEMLAAITDDLSVVPSAVCLESVATRPGQGVVSQGSLLHSLGILEAALELSFPCDVTHVAPSTWKKDLGMSGGEKADSVMMCRLLFPNIFDSKKSDIWLKKHNGRADAVLIALWKAIKDNPTLLHNEQLMQGFAQFKKSVAQRKQSNHTDADSNDYNLGDGDE